MSPPAAGQPWTPRTGWGGQWGTPLASNPGGSRTSWPQTVTPPPAQARLWGTPPPPPGRDAPVAATPPPPSTIAGAYNAMDAAWVPPFSGVGSQNQIAVHAEHYPRRWVDAPRDERARAPLRGGDAQPRGGRGQERRPLERAARRVQARRRGRQRGLRGIGPGPHAPPGRAMSAGDAALFAAQLPVLRLWKLPPRPRLQDSRVSPGSRASTATTSATDGP